MLILAFRNHGSNFEQPAFESGAPALKEIQKDSQSAEIGEKS